jgi:hypothetical protein
MRSGEDLSMVSAAESETVCPERLELYLYQRGYIVSAHAGEHSPQAGHQDWLPVGARIIPRDRPTVVAKMQR